WANVPDTNITESSVVQHQSALTITESQISDLSHFIPTDLLTDYGFVDNSIDWDTAFSWGDHSTVGYITTAYGGAPYYIVAANDSSATLKNRADYICEGTEDETEINNSLALGNVKL